MYDEDQHYVINPILLHKIIHKGTVRFDEPVDRPVEPMYHDSRWSPALPNALREELLYLQVDMMLEYPYYWTVADFQRNN